MWLGFKLSDYKLSDYKLSDYRFLDKLVWVYGPIKFEEIVIFIINDEMINISIILRLLLMIHLTV